MSLVSCPVISSLQHDFVHSFAGLCFGNCDMICGTAYEHDRAES
jgi:hypothetical protein